MLRKSFRYSQGPLYSEGELAMAERYLADMGMTKKEDNTALGIRIYSNPAGGPASASIYLDELGAHPDLSGTMIVSKRAGDTKCDTVWNFAQKGFKERATLPFVKTAKKMLGMKP